MQLFTLKSGKERITPETGSWNAKKGGENRQLWLAQVIEMVQYLKQQAHQKEGLQVFICSE